MPEKYGSQFDVEGVSFSMQDHLMMIEIENEFASAKLTTHGGSILSFTPKSGVSSGKNILWVSSKAIYDGSKPVRGGVPVCWPWFGGHPTESNLPAHGFVRNKVWHLQSASKLANGGTEVVLTISDDDDTLSLWPHAFNLQLRVEVAEKLTVTLETHNPNDHDFVITEALHTYFAVADCTEISVVGLEGSRHQDKLSDSPESVQHGSVALNPPRDSVYLDQQGVLSFEDSGNHRTIVVEQNGQSAVVWNPGPDGVKSFSDIENTDWRQFVCVEAGNVLTNSITVGSEQKHQMVMSISAE